MKFVLRKPGIFLAGNLLLALLLSGCASLPFLTSDQIPEPEQESVRLAFQAMRNRQGRCSPYVDADVTLTLKNYLLSGSLPGSLLAMSPSFIRFEGLNSLGLPEMILASDGAKFRYLAVREEKDYEGKVSAEKFLKYAPKGFQPASTFSWLTGSLPPGTITLEEVRRARDSKTYWIEVSIGKDELHRRILFDPKAKIIHRHQVLAADGDLLLDVTYEGYQEGGGEPLAAPECVLPARVVAASTGNGTMIVEFDKRYESSVLKRDNFEVDIPGDFEKVEVK